MRICLRRRRSMLDGASGLSEVRGCTLVLTRGGGGRTQVHPNQLRRGQAGNSISLDHSDRELSSCAGLVDISFAARDSPNGSEKARDILRPPLRRTMVSWRFDAVRKIRSFRESNRSETA